MRKIIPSKIPCQLIEDFFFDLNKSNNLDLRKTLAGDFSNVGKPTAIDRAFIDDNEFLFSCVLPCVAHLLNSNEFVRKLVQFEKKRLEGIGKLHLIIQKKIAEKVVTLETLEEDSGSIYREVILSLIKTPSKNQTVDNYFYAYLLEIAYENFLYDLGLEKKYNRTELKENLISQYYQKIGIDITKTDRQFSKYDLYTVDMDCEIFEGRPPRIIDKKNNLQFIIEMQEELLHLLDISKKRGYIKDLALLARSQTPIETDKRISFMFGTDKAPVLPKITNFIFNRFPNVVKEVIYSRILSEDGLFSSDVIYKFYDTRFDDEIWVFSYKDEVLFEEILGKPEIRSNDVVTQMIHLKYELDEGRVKIVHIDHEYLFYTYEEFDRRHHNYRQRAEAKNRIKTFKVDRSRLPLLFDDGTFVLYAVLDAYFEKAFFLQEFLVQGCGLMDAIQLARQIEKRSSLE